MLPSPRSSSGDLTGCRGTQKGDGWLGGGRTGAALLAEVPPTGRVAPSGPSLLLPAPCHPHFTDEEAEAQGGREGCRGGLFPVLCSRTGPSLPWDQPAGCALSHPPGHMPRDWDTCCTPGVQHRGPKSKGTSYSPEGLWGLGPAGGVAGHDPEADQLQEPGGSGWVRHEGNRAWNQLPDTQADRPAAPPGSGDEGHLCACRGYLPGSVFTLACPSASTLGEHRAQAAATGCVPSPKPTIPCGAVAAGGALGALSRGRGPRQWDWWVS